MNERQNKIEALKQYYLKELVEDPQDGTPFDSSIIDALDRLITTWGDTPDEEAPMTTEQAKKWMEENIGEEND